jgi:uncharacterized membrane protein
MRAASGPRRPAAVAVILASTGLAIATYLTAVRVAGELPACGPAAGCETVALSSYSVIAGVPVAVLGLAFSVAMVALTATWWRNGSRRAQLAAYGLGLFGLLFVAYLTYLELVVIHAVCAWCVAYGATVLFGWVITAVALARGTRGPAVSRTSAPR